MVVQECVLVQSEFHLKTIRIYDELEYVIMNSAYNDAAFSTPPICPISVFATFFLNIIILTIYYIK